MTNLIQGFPSSRQISSAYPTIPYYMFKQNDALSNDWSSEISCIISSVGVQGQLRIIKSLLMIENLKTM